jgi:hypothetical protein
MLKPLLGILLQKELVSQMRHAAVSASTVAALDTSRWPGHISYAVCLLMLLLLTVAGRLPLHVMLADAICFVLSTHKVLLCTSGGLGLHLLICGKAREDAGRRIQVSLRLQAPLPACWWLQQCHGARS